MSGEQGEAAMGNSAQAGDLAAGTGAGSRAANPPVRFLRNAVILGLLTAIGPFAIDMYLPALPSIGASLGADSGAVLMSMTAFFVSFAAFQLVFGPLSDMIGRKPPLYVGIALFALASIGCALAGDVRTLILFRALQGVGGAAGIVIPRAIVRDLHRGVDEARLLSLLMLVFSVSPLLAPLVGSQVVELASWRGVFWLVCALALLALLMLALAVRETRPSAQRSGRGFAGVFEACGKLARDPRFLGMTFIGGFALSGFFVFLSNSSFVMMGRYHFTATEYSLAFSVNAAAFFFTSQFNGWLGARFGLAAMVRPALWGYAAALAVMCVLAAAGVDNYWAVGAPFFISNAFLGLVMPVTSVLALDAHGPIAGTAASLLSTLQLAVGAAVMAISGKFADGTLAPMVYAIAVCGLAAFATGMVTPIVGRSAGAAPGG